MARRISKKTIGLMKDSVRISDVFDWLGVRMEPTRNMAWCPMCSDKDSRHPGMSYDDENGLWHCFVHGGGGDLISFVMELEGVSFSEAVERICNHFGVPIEYEGKVTEADSANYEYVRALNRAQQIFESQRVSPKFKRFVEDRHITDATVRRYGLGMSDGKWAAAAVARLEADFPRDVLIGCGLCVESGNVLRLRYVDRAMFPIRNTSGMLVGFGGRDVTGRAPAKYVNTNDTPVFHKRDLLYGYDQARRSIARERMAIICEGYMDTIALQTHGFPCAIGAMGTAVTHENLMYLSHYADVIYMSLDADKAGRAAAKRIADHLPRKFRPTVRVVMIPREVAKDPDEFFNDAGKTRADFQGILDGSPTLLGFCVRMEVSDEVGTIRTALDGVGNGDSRAAMPVASARERAMAKAGEFVSSHIGLASGDELVAIASWLVDAVGSTESPDNIVARWRIMSSGRAQKGSKVDAEGVRVRQAASRGEAVAVGSAATETEDRLIASAYYHPEVRGAVAAADGFDMDTVITSPVRHGIVDKVFASQSRGGTGRDAIGSMTTDETRELSRILGKYRDGSGLGISVIGDIVADAELDEARRAVKAAEESAEPDFMALIGLRKRLTDLEAAKRDRDSRRRAMTATA